MRQINFMFTRESSPKIHLNTYLKFSKFLTSSILEKRFSTMLQGEWASLHWLWDCLQHGCELQMRASLKPH